MTLSFSLLKETEPTASRVQYSPKVQVLATDAVAALIREHGNDYQRGSLRAFRSASDGAIWYELTA